MVDKVPVGDESPSFQNFYFSGQLREIIFVSLWAASEKSLAAPIWATAAVNYLHTSASQEPAVFNCFKIGVAKNVSEPQA